MCLEGVTDSLPTLKIVSRSGETQVPASVQAGINRGFYSNVELNVAGLTEVSFEFQNGALNATRSISWTTTNILETHSLVIRKGDALKVAAWQPGKAASGTCTLALDGQPVLSAGGNASHAAGTPVVVDFNTASTHVLVATWTPDDGSPAVTSSTKVIVREGTFGTALDLLALHCRPWLVPGIGVGLSVESDDTLTWVEDATAGQPRHFLVSTYDTGTKYVLARVPETGDVLARGTVNAFHIAQADRTSDAHLVEVLPDGTRRYRFTIMATNLPENAEIRIRTYHEGATFPDGGRDLILRASDFGSTGIANIYIDWELDGIPEFCHGIDIFAVGPQ